MPTITRNTPLAKLPATELKASLREFLQPLTELLPDPRLEPVAELMVQGIVTSQSPVVTQIARGSGHDDATVWPTSKRAYRFLANPRFDARVLLKGLYRIGQRTVRVEQPAYLVIALDPVNFEKPYTHHLQGVSTVHKATPPSLSGDARLTRGYPAMTATIVNLACPAVSYANWFSYQTAEFVSQNRELYRALRTSRALFPREKLRFVGDAGLDDQKLFHQVARVNAEFVIRACHPRQVEVHNARLDRWEPEALRDLTDNIAFEFSRRVTFTHARRTRRALIRFGWLKIRLPDTQQVLWVIVAYDEQRDHNLVLLTNIALETEADVWQAYTDWRQRSQIEHGYRFDQEQGLDVEDMRVTTLERMRRLFILVLLSAQFVGYVAQTWAKPAIQWLRRLGGKLGLASDRDGPYVLLRGISAAWQAVATLTFLSCQPFPWTIQGCG